MAPRMPAPPAGAHETFYRVCYADTDQMARVYYANYLIWCERARTELLRASGYTYLQMEEDQCYLPVRHCDVRYHGYACYDDEVRLLTWTENLRHASVTFITAAFITNEKGVESRIVTCAVELVCVGQTGKPIQISKRIQEALQPTMVETPVSKS